MPETTFTGPDLTTFLGLDALGLTAVGQHLTANRAVIECRMPAGFEDPFCKACGAQGVARGTVARRLAHVPVGWRSTQLVVRVRRFACTHCCRVWRHEIARKLRGAVVMRTRAPEGEGRAVTSHAKFLSIDHRFLLVGSAKFSYSAEECNVELGLRLDDPALAHSVEKQMRDLEANVYEPVP